MKLAYFPQQMALNSQPVWHAFLEGCKKINISVEENSYTADAAVIWSVLWQGRLQKNQAVYQHYQSQGKPVFIIEVGALNRGVTWKISINHINSCGIYPTMHEVDNNRQAKLGVQLKPENTNRGAEILIAAQHTRSLQWENMPTAEIWISNIISEIAKYSDRAIVVRPHPRCPLLHKQLANVRVETACKIPNTYDKYDLGFDYHCVINYSSGPGIQTAIAGTPVIVNASSLAYPVSSVISEIETIKLPDRNKWFNDILYTEWLVEEIAQGIPQRLLLMHLHNR